MARAQGARHATTIRDCDVLARMRAALVVMLHDTKEGENKSDQGDEREDDRPYAYGSYLKQAQCIAFSTKFEPVFEPRALLRKPARIGRVPIRATDSRPLRVEKPKRNLILPRPAGA